VREQRAAVRDRVAHSDDDMIVRKCDSHEVALRPRGEGGAVDDVGDDVRDRGQVASRICRRVNQIDDHPVSTSHEIRTYPFEHNFHDVRQCWQWDLLEGRHRGRPDYVLSWAEITRTAIRN